MQAEIIECGVSTAFGATLAETLSKREERRAAFFSNEAFIDKDFRSQLCAFRERTGVSTFAERVSELLGEATRDFTQRYSTKNENGGSQTVDLVLVLPEVQETQGLNRDTLSAIGRKLCADLEKALPQSGLQIGQQTIRASGHAGVGSALAEYLGKASDDGKWLLIAAVDSYNDTARLNALNDAGYLFSKKHQFGFIPGEAAGLLLLKPASQRGSGIRLLGAGQALEPIGEFQESETRFDAQSEAAFVACEAVFKADDCPRSVSHCYSDWNNSRYRATELSFAIHRINPYFLRESLQPSYPALQFGDIGAAYGAVALCIGGIEIQTSRPTGDRVGQVPAFALVLAGSPGGLRSAVLMG